jgi:hypothetical protein
VAWGDVDGARWVGRRRSTQRSAVSGDQGPSGAFRAGRRQSRRTGTSPPSCANSSSTRSTPRPTTSEPSSPTTSSFAAVRCRRSPPPRSPSWPRAGQGARRSRLDATAARRRARGGRAADPTIRSQWVPLDQPGPALRHCRRARRTGRTTGRAEALCCAVAPNDPAMVHGAPCHVAPRGVRRLYRATRCDVPTTYHANGKQRGHRPFPPGDRVEPLVDGGVPPSALADHVPLHGGPPPGSARIANPVGGSVEAHPDVSARPSQLHSPIDEPIDLTPGEGAPSPVKRAVGPAVGVNIGCRRRAIKPAFDHTRRREYRTPAACRSVLVLVAFAATRPVLAPPEAHTEAQRSGRTDDEKAEIGAGDRQAAAGAG